MSRFPILAIVVLALFGAATQAEPDTATKGAELVLKSRKPEDRVKVSHTQDGVVLRVTCPSGISDLEATLKEGTWPRHITLQLELGSLESFGVSNGQLSLSGSLRAAGEQGVLWFNERGERVEESAKAIHSMKIKAAADGKRHLIEVVLPTGFCSKDTKTLKIGWIDAFRR